MVDTKAPQGVAATPRTAGSARAGLLAWAIAAAAACTTPAMIPEVAPEPDPLAESTAFFGDLLERYVAIDGQVDFARWKSSAEDVAMLDAYAESLLASPPHAHPEDYPTPATELAYWLNLYNALSLRAVLAHWPLESLADLPSEGPFGAAKGLLYDLRFDVGGSMMNLLDIEARIAAARFEDPRAHFAVSCGARSCPLVPRSPFDGVTLDRRLDDAARAFLNRRGSVRVDDAGHRVLVPAILGWYERDFVAYVARRLPVAEPSLFDLLALYADGELARGVARARRDHYRIELLPYDWRLGGAGVVLDDAAEPTALELSEPLPVLDLERLDGTRFNTTDAFGKVLLLDFWATWCRPCLYSFPRYGALQVAHEKRGLVVVTVSQDDARDPVVAFVAAGHTKLDVVLDPALWTAKPPLSITTLPTVVLVDRRGRIRFRQEGYGGAGFAALEAKIEELLAEPP
jgi:thiol-disulfide isomerase/thioredoxin